MYANGLRSQTINNQQVGPKASKGPGQLRWKSLLYVIRSYAGWLMVALPRPNEA